MPKNRRRAATPGQRQERMAAWLRSGEADFDQAWLNSLNGEELLKHEEELLAIAMSIEEELLARSIQELSAGFMNSIHEINSNEELHQDIEDKTLAAPKKTPPAAPKNAPSKKPPPPLPITIILYNLRRLPSFQIA